MHAREDPDKSVPTERYEIGALLGRGGMAEVYLGQDRVLGRRVAIKLLAGDTAPQTGQAQRLRSEARAAACIEHPNVVRVHDLTLTETTIFVVMEYLEGETLRARLERESVLPVDLAVRIGTDVCLALAAAHQAGVIHRDIGPGNIMLCADGTVKVMDFGIARIAGNAFQTAPGQTLGTPAYLSPEQATGAEVDAPSDLYSLGCTLYHMVTGQPPFTGSSAIEVAHQHGHAIPRPPRTLAPDLPAPLEAVILQAMAKSPDQRFRDALQMRALLLSVLDETPTHDTAATGAVTSAAPTPVQTVPLQRDGRAQDRPSDRARPEATPAPTPSPGRESNLLDADVAVLAGADADRRRRWLGLGLLLVGLVVLAVAIAALLQLP